MFYIMYWVSYCAIWSKLPNSVLIYTTFDCGCGNILFNVFFNTFSADHAYMREKGPENGQFCFKSQFYDKISEKNIIWSIFGVMTIYQKLQLITVKKFFFSENFPENGQFCFKSQFYDKMSEKNIIWGIFGVMTIYQRLQLTHSVRITHICVKKG